MERLPDYPLWCQMFSCKDVNNSYFTSLEILLIILFFDIGFAFHLIINIKKSCHVPTSPQSVTDLCTHEVCLSTISDVFDQRYKYILAI